MQANLSRTHGESTSTGIRRKHFRYPSLVALILSFMSCLAIAQTSEDKAWSILQAGVTDKSTDQRAASVQVLGLIENDARATDSAINALQDNDPTVRAAAVGALGRMNAKSAAPKLQQLAQTDKEPSVVLACGRALIDLGDPFGYGVYYAILTGEKKSGGSLLDDQKKMLQDPKKMAQFGFEQGVGFIPFGGLGLTAFKGLTRDDSSPVRAAAAKILATDKDPRTAKALVTAASDKSWIVRAAALDAISHRNDPTLASEIEPQLDDEKEVVRYTAAAAIIHLHDVQTSAPIHKKK